MRKKIVFLSQKDIEDRYSAQGLQLLDEFNGVHIPLRYICTCGEIHRKTPNSLLQKVHMCPDAFRQLKKIDKQKEYEKLFRSMGAELLSDYKGPKVPVRYRCVCGEISEITPSSFRRGRRCFECGKKKAYSIRMGIILEEKQIESTADKFMRELLELIKKNGGELIDKSGKYVTFKCKCCSIDTKTIISFRKNPSCKDCARKVANEVHFKRVQEVMRVTLHDELRTYNLEYISGKYEHLTSEIQVKCLCGDIFVTSLRALRLNKNPQMCPKCYNLSIRGSGNHQWVEDRSAIIPQRDTSKAYDDWRRNVYARDWYTCRACGKQQKLNVHHILNYKQHPELRLETSNGITLCAECHKKFHKKYGRLDNTQEQIDEFISHEFGSLCQL